MRGRKARGILTGIASVSGMCLCAAVSSGAADDATSYQDWQFTTSANPTVPTVTTNAAGVSTNTIVVGTAGAGWLYSLPGFGTQTGLWDLGSQGQVLLNIPNPIPAGGGSYTDFELQVVQFVDGGIYTGDLAFSIPGALRASRTIIQSLPLGNWVQDVYQWLLTPSPAQVSLTITGAVDGTILDEIIASTDTPPAPPQPIVINSVVTSNQVLVITWAGGVPPYQVYAGSNLVNAVSWLPVGPPVTATSAQVPMNPPIGFVRVGGSSQ